MNTNKNRRQHLRHSAFFSVRYTVKEGTFRDLITNIGAGGAFISTRRHVNLNQTVSIRFPTFAFEKQFYAKGIVVRQNSSGFAVSFNAPVDEKICHEGQPPGILSERNRMP
ncbi:MAG: PilZ domain-containing protein [Desulfosarcina sp.]|jgi:c-di-GMP-binding flagellar brake protein YcgR